jgi:hypothetical protein
VPFLEAPGSEKGAPLTVQAVTGAPSSGDKRYFTTLNDIGYW